MTEEKKKPKEQKKPRPPRLPIGLVPPDLAIRLSLTRPLIDAVPRDIDSPPKLLPIRNLREEYEYLQHLGHGSFGDVNDARNNVKTGLVAIKTMMRRSDTIYSYLRLKELQFIISIPSHPSLVQVFDMVIDDYAFELHIVMECMNQNLYQFMRTRVYKFSSGSVKSILTQLLGAINHIHEHGYFHRDVKPENILIISAIDYYGSREAIPQHRANDNYVVKLADYGLARSIYTTGNYTAYVATRWYRAPEILLRREIHSQPVDIWSFGVIAIELANFTPMVTGDDELDQLNKTIAIIGSPIPPPYDHYHPNVYYPLGGYWKEAQYLAEKLKLKIPLTSGISIYELLPDPNYADINDLVRLCITWDPERRASSSMLCDLPY
ncbi:kinase-like domain-containing protein, partial [Scheffersomyces coipomensis]|uniref:kinase-like domain-containing protein n=1 Tax=Scheffersomyces coipomensis TaxID=1788519 RepID=UPI00315C6C88